jgi:signal transduction histidine kinase/ABC-type branched-subunit amino acid transport system ATPase component
MLGVMANGPATANRETVPGAAPEPLLTAAGLSVSFGPVPALTGVDLAVGASELVAVAGEPGAGKTTLVRCLGGDIVPDAGEIRLAGRPLPAVAGAGGGAGIAVVWQDLELCDNLDVAGNLLLGQETRRLMLSDARFHARAAAILDRLDIPIRDTTQLVGHLGGAQRQLLAIARAVNRDPRILVLDEPTSSLRLTETAQIEALIGGLRARGTTVLMVSSDIEQMLRIADRIVVLRHGRVVAELDPRSTHPDDVVALQSGQQVDSSARRQLTRLHGLAHSLVSADPSSSLSLILSALGAALGAERACIHVTSAGVLVCAASLGFTPDQVAAWARLPLGTAGGPAGRAAALGERIMEDDLWAHDGGRGPLRTIAAGAAIATSWSIPVSGPDGVSAVITVFLPERGGPERDEVDLLALYAGYAASAVERDRLLDAVTARNRVLEANREMLQTLAGPASVSDGLASALRSLRRGLQADEVGLLTRIEEGRTVARGYAGAAGTDPGTASEALLRAADAALSAARRDGIARELGSESGRRVLAVAFNAPGGPSVLLALSSGERVSDAEASLIEDAAHSLNLALEREEAGLAHQEAAALRRSRELQRGFLSRLSHELRTPLTAIRGYASSLMAPDVTWDGDSQQRFLERIAAESARLGRLVDDLLDFSAIESGVMRLQHDWCEIRLVAEAAVACLPAEERTAVTVRCDPALPVVWADHDRLEQVFVNLLTNAIRHNPPGTHVTVGARKLESAEVEITVSDDGGGFPSELAPAPFDSAARHRSPSAGAGLGLSIARGIVDAHQGGIELAPVPHGTAFVIRLPVEAGAPAQAGEPPFDGDELVGADTAGLAPRHV